jgi:hypothetical protein
MYRRLLAKLRSVLASPADPAAMDGRIDERIDARLEARLDQEVERRVAERLEQMARLTNDRGQPNINSLWRSLKDLETLQLDVKLLGYQMGLAHEYRLQAIPVEAPGPFMADCKPVTQGDMETRWFRFWCEQLKERPRYHRKLWEFAYLMQALHCADAIKPGAKVLILGAAHQPTASYLAAKGADVVIAQHGDEPMPGAGADPLCNEDLVDAKTFAKRVTRRVVDLAALPDDLAGFDACVGMDQAMRRGTVRAGMDYVVASIDRVRPGGLVAHVVDFNYADDAQTLDDWGSVLFLRRHLEAMTQAWTAAGHEVAPLDFNVGFQAMDRFVDIPPFDVSRTESLERLWRDGWQAAHLKTAVDGFPATSFGLIARRARG